MTWTATPQNVSTSSAGVAVQCVLTDGSQKIVQSFLTDGTTANLQALAIAATQSLDGIHVKSDIIVGVPIDLTPPVVKQPNPPTADELARQAWSVARGSCRAIQRGIAETIPGYDGARLQAAQSSRDKLYQASFEDLV